MPTVEGPDETGVSYEIKFLEDKYVGNDLHSMLLILLSIVSKVDIEQLLLALAEYR